MPIKSLGDDLLSCPLEALRVVIPKNFIQGAGVGQTPLEKFINILVHQQISIRKIVLTLSFFLLYYEFFLAHFFFQHAVKLVALYDKQLEYLCSYPQELTKLTAKVSSLEYEASRLKNLDPEVEKVQSLLAERDQELGESQRREAVAEERVAASNQLTYQLEEHIRRSSELQTQLADAKARCGSLSAGLALFRADLCAF